MKTLIHIYDLCRAFSDDHATIDTDIDCLGNSTRLYNGKLKDVPFYLCEMEIVRLRFVGYFEIIVGGESNA